MTSVGSQSMVARLRRVIVKRPEDAFRSGDRIEKEWKQLGYTRPDLNRAIHHHQEFVALMKQAGAEVLYLPADERTGLDSLYVHDPVLMTGRGAVIFQTGKIARRGEGQQSCQSNGARHVILMERQRLKDLRGRRVAFDCRPDPSEYLRMTV